MAEKWWDHCHSYFASYRKAEWLQREPCESSCSSSTWKILLTHAATAMGPAEQLLTLWLMTPTSAKLHKRVWLTEIWILWQLLLSLLQVYRMARIWVNLSEHFIWFSEEINNRVKGQCPSLDSQHILEHSDEEDPQVNDRTVLIKLARTSWQGPLILKFFYISYGSTI